MGENWKQWLVNLLPSNIKCLPFLKVINICKLPWLNQKRNTGDSRVSHGHRESKLILQFAYLKKSLRALFSLIIVPTVEMMMKLRHTAFSNRRSKPRQSGFRIHKLNHYDLLSVWITTDYKVNKYDNLRH